MSSSRRQLPIAPRGAHGDHQRLVVEADLERLLDRHPVGLDPPPGVIHLDPYEAGFIPYLAHGVILPWPAEAYPRTVVSAWLRTGTRSGASTYSGDPSSGCSS